MSHYTRRDHEPVGKLLNRLTTQTVTCVCFHLFHFHVSSFIPILLLSLILSANSPSLPPPPLKLSSFVHPSFPPHILISSPSFPPCLLICLSPFFHNVSPPHPSPSLSPSLSPDGWQRSSLLWSGQLFT